MKLAHNLFPKDFPHEKFGDLMRKSHNLFPKQFPCEQLRMLMEEREGLFRKDVTVRKLLDLMKLGRNLFPNEFSHEKFVDLMILAYELFSNFPREKFGDLMRKAHDLFPKEFPREPFSKTFTEMITILVNRNSTLKDEVFDHKLLCLLDVSVGYSWPEFSEFTGSRRDICRRNAEFGKQFFVLCKSVAQWNIDDFHPELSGAERLKIMQDAKKGINRVDDEDVGLVVVEFSHLR